MFKISISFATIPNMGIKQETEFVPELSSNSVSIRFHHLSKLMDLAGSYRRLSGGQISVPFQMLYLHPQASWDFIQTATRIELNEAKMIFSGNFLGFGKLEVPPEYAEDFIGKKGRKVGDFMKATASAFETLVVSRPATKVELSCRPDIICATCQVNGQNRPGNHCVLPRTKDINSDSDEIHLRALLDLLSDSNTSDNIRNQFVQSEHSGEVAFTTNIGVLRSEEFMERFKIKVDKIWDLLD